MGDIFFLFRANIGLERYDEDEDTEEIHAMVIDGAEEQDGEWYFQCKNTYKNNPQVFVGHAELHFIEYKPFDAIIISFDRK